MSFDYLVIVSCFLVCFISLSQDQELPKRGIENVSDLFDQWLNVMPTGQGSRTIRTEEAILVTLSTMRNKIFKY